MQYIEILNYTKRNLNRISFHFFIIHLLSVKMLANYHYIFIIIVNAVAKKILEIGYSEDLEVRKRWCVGGGGGGGERERGGGGVLNRERLRICVISCSSTKIALLQ